MSYFQKSRDALQRICRYVHRTPLEYSPLLSKMSGAEVYLKLENFQITGSFKARGALNKILSLSEEELKRGVVTASSGNHGAAVSYALSKAKAKGIVFVPENVVPSKADNIRLWGADVKFYGTDSGVCEPVARKYGEDNGMVYVSPYNDEAVMAGQGTVGVEIYDHSLKNPMDAVIVAIGGGGLIGGIGGALKEKWPDVKIVGTSPKNSCDMILSIREGKMVNAPSLDTLSDGTAGEIELSTITFEPCRQFVDVTDLPEEDEIRSAMEVLIGKHHLLVEGSAALPLATLLRRKEDFQGKRVTLVLCGANVSHKTLKGLWA